MITDSIIGEITDFTSDGKGVLRSDSVVCFAEGGVIGDIVKVAVTKRAKNYCEGVVKEILSESKFRIEPDCSAFGKCGGCDFRNFDYNAQLNWKKSFVEKTLRKIGNVESAPNRTINGNDNSSGNYESNADSIVEQVIASENENQYRNHFQIPIRSEKGKLKYGFFAKKSNEVVPLDNCPMMQQEVRDMLAELALHLQNSKIPVISETAFQGNSADRNPVKAHADSSRQKHLKLKGLRHIGVRISPDNEIILILVSNSKIPHEKVSEFVRAATTSGFTAKHNIISIYENTGDAEPHTTYAKEWSLIWGAEYWHESVCGKKFRLHPASFFQINRPQAEKLYRIALDYAGLSGCSSDGNPKDNPAANHAPDSEIEKGAATEKDTTTERGMGAENKTAQGASLLDLYCGVGSIGISAENTKLRELVGIEIIPEAAGNAAHNAQLNGIKNASYYSGPCERLLKEALQNFAPDVVILDPPRGGADKSTLAELAAKAPKRIVYVSCDPVTLARDIKILSEYGYSPTRCAVVDMFPMTTHVETVVLMSRR